MSGLMSDLLMANAFHSQAQMLRNVQTNFHNSEGILKIEMQLDAGRGQSIVKKQEQLKGMGKQEGVANQYLSDTTSKEQKELSKASKDKDDTTVKKVIVNSKELTVLQQQKQTVSSQIVQLQTADATANSQQIQQLQQQLQTIQGTIQQVQASASSGTSNNQDVVTASSVPDVGPAYTLEVSQQPTAEAGTPVA
ncbi:vacuolar-type H+-ATPase subunit I/STV1 [Sporomusaceae bacterium BoRhaA]|uniref:hypothetical protein n=1 Tax=Pelorhabdus rhamnosifermentans TaxID=2772457 RepID=UPI001C062307|nr:hypothetical protein [Pelorhabdus rhamnosifermentans]MBU2699579.1 vacuolar-type H+-ATPase subunit I/STV1 [Pelorhabdus rhamnosifermentans]